MIRAVNALCGASMRWAKLTLFPSLFPSLYPSLYPASPARALVASAMRRGGGWR